MSYSNNIKKTKFRGKTQFNKYMGNKKEKESRNKNIFKIYRYINSY